MAITFGALCGGNNTKSFTGSKFNPGPSYSTAVAAGKLVVLIVGIDNQGTTDADESAISSVTDTAGNVFTKAREYTKSGGAALGGATCSIWYSVLTTAVTTSNSLNINIGTVGTRGAAASTMAYFNVGAPIIVEATAVSVTTGANPPSLALTTANIECLRVRGSASETSTATNWTPTASWTVFAVNTTTGGSGVANMGARGEFRIVTATSGASTPTITLSADHANVIVALKEGPVVAQAITATSTPAAVVTIRRVYSPVIPVIPPDVVSLTMIKALSKAISATSAEVTSVTADAVYAPTVPRTGFGLLTRHGPSGHYIRRLGTTVIGGPVTTPITVSATSGSTVTVARIASLSKAITVTSGSTVTVARAVTVTSVGSAAGSSTVSAIGRAITALIGGAAGSGAANAVGRAIAASTATASGQGAANAVGAPLASGIGSATGQGTVSGVGASIAAAVGNAAGAGAATGYSPGVTIITAVGTADGTSVVSGLASSLVVIEAVGTITVEAAVPFTPDSIAGLLAWVDIADDGVILSGDYTPISDGKDVQAVSNKGPVGGGTFTQTDPAKYPIYKISPFGLPGLYRTPYTGRNSWLSAGTGAQYDIREMTVFVVSDIGTAGGATDYFNAISRIDYDYWDGWYFSVSWGSATQGRTNLYQVDMDSGYTESDVVAVRTFPAGRPVVYVGRRGASSIEAGLTGSPLTTGLKFDTYAVPSGPYPLVIMGVGGNPGEETGPYSSWTGYLHEVLLYNSAISDSDRWKNEGYLAWKWHLESDLPVGHPYKDAAPAWTAGVGAFGVGAATAAATGSAAGSSTVAGVGNFTAFVAGTGSAVGTGTASGVGNFSAILTATGNAAGAGTASAVGVGTATVSIGSAAGIGSASATGASIARSVGSAAGAATATASGVSLRAAIGSSINYATVQGVGTSVAFSVGTAFGAAEAVAVASWSVAIVPDGTEAIGLVGQASVRWGGIVVPDGEEEIWAPEGPGPGSPWVPVVPPGTEIWRPIVR